VIIVRQQVMGGVATGTSGVHAALAPQPVAARRGRQLTLGADPPSQALCVSEVTCPSPIARWIAPIRMSASIGLHR
jgi:hypothetical protein